MSSYDELTAIRADPGMRRQAQRLAGDLAEDLLQQTWYIVALASARKPIERLGGYFYRVMVNAAKRMREDIARHGIPVDDPVAAAGARGGRDLATVSAEDAALGPLLADARRESLRCRRAELRLRIPASSPDPNRYRDVILATAVEVGADLIVVGSKGMQRRYLGSVPNSVAHGAHCAVLVVKTD